MAAEIQSEIAASRQKPELLNKLEGCGGTINMVLLIPREEGVITIGTDRTLRVWLKRDSGQYWPSIYQSFSAVPTAINYSMETRRLFVGFDNGGISEYILGDDYNKMTPQREYSAHQNYVTSIHFALSCEWLLSGGRDKIFTWHCSETSRRMGEYHLNAWCTALEFDLQTKHVFIGDLSGQITVLKVEHQTTTYITTLKGHSGSIRCLAWDADRKLLFSGSFDQSIIVWDIGGQKGTAYELQGHHQKVTGLCYSSASQVLFSCAEDCMLVAWDMSTDRCETPDWLDSDVCERCSEPFFWNVKEMWEKKTIGVRQHHCRKCGKAICDKCSSKRTKYPIMGYEFAVRVCDDCYDTITDEDRVNQALFSDAKHHVVCMNLDVTSGRLVTAGTDRIIKVWDVSRIRPSR